MKFRNFMRLSLVIFKYGKPIEMYTMTMEMFTNTDLCEWHLLMKINELTCKDWEILALNLRSTKAQKFAYILFDDIEIENRYLQKNMEILFNLVGLFFLNWWE